ncbi:MAG: DUF3160 domain-containing protein [Candidatus Buchananbacteria bacterium]
MEDKKPLLIAAIIVVILLIVSAVGVFVFLQKSNTQTEIPAPPPEVNTNYNYLPPSTEVNANQAAMAEAKSKLEKDKQFISSFWQPWELKYTAESPSYKLPLEKIKEQVTNYRDFSRKINLDNSLAKLTTNGFVVVNNPFSSNTNDWQSNYKLIRENKIPILITSDSVAGIYQDTLNVIYKEIEQEIFYPSLWQLLKDTAQQARERYEKRQGQFGIKTDLVTEANRLEVAFLTVGLKLLQPETAQVKDSLAADNKFFSSQEAGLYTIGTPPYLANEINAEIKLIKAKTKSAKSPIFLYPKNYQNYTIPAQYSTSEKLKNYYLAITWLNENLFPLWNKSNDCPNCLLDQADQNINLIAALYLSDDLAKNQALKNRWANIYKSISFFKGLEADLTYLDYQQALKEIFGNDYDLEKIFSADQNSTDQSIAKIQAKINSYSFPKVLSLDRAEKEKIGLRLLRNRYLMEEELFQYLTNESTGEFTGSLQKGQVLPYTACQKDKAYFRCFPVALDLFSLLGNQTAKEINEKTLASQYANYQKNLADFTEKLKEFDDHTWHDNAYLSLLSSLKYLNNGLNGLPAFMQTDIWKRKQLNTSLGAWVDFHADINFEKKENEETNSIRAYFPYGYIEPQPEFYSSLLANINMVIEGFTNLQIISNQSESFERLVNLKNILQKVTEISKKELTKEVITADDYDFINSFNQQIDLVTGDIKKENIQNRNSFGYLTYGTNGLFETLAGLNYLIAVYPDTNGKLYFAVGPVFNYLENKTKDKPTATWQLELFP